MRIYLFTIVSALAAMSPAAIAQSVNESSSAEPDDGDTARLTPQQQAEYDGWPVELRAYYSSLDDERQELFWLLSDEDKQAIVAMPEPDRTAAWEMVEARIDALRSADPGTPDNPATPVPETPEQPGDY